MKGVTVIEKDNYSIIFIHEFSEEFKSAIRSKLSTICHGAADAVTGHSLYSYSNTIKEFIKRYNDKTDSQRTGMLGELLVHILLTEQLTGFTVNSPFFNTEERNVKKGFDVVLTKSESNELWLAEVKSGELHSNKNTSQTAVELINTAQNDLNARLNGDSVSLWLNAVNGAKAAIDEHRDDRNAIISLLQTCGDSATEEKLKSHDINVILVGTVFSSLQDRINEASISSKYTRIANKKCFRQIYLIAIQKETYQRVFQFLEGESKL